MSESQSRSDRPTSDPGEKVESSSSKKRRWPFSIIFKGVRFSRRPRIIPDDLGEDSSGNQTEPQDSRVTTDVTSSPSATTASATPAPDTSPAPGKKASTWEQPLLRAFIDAAPLWTVLLVLALVLMFAAWWLIPRIEQALDPRAPREPVEAAALASEHVASTEYTDDLHAFSVSYADGEPWAATPTTLDCVGSVFALEAAGSQAQDPKYPRLQVCFLNFASNQPEKPLNEYLEERRAKPMGLRVLLPDPGMIRDVEIGTAKTSGRGAYLLGTEAESSRPAKWYTAVVNFEGRIYAVEAIATQEEWATYWPRFARLMERIKFETGVIQPAPTPIMID